jgi:outer membrane protein OmpA-like peptidoglycan-associated protein
VGESPGQTKKALGAMIPTILAGAAHEASTSSGASRLFDQATEVATGGPDLVSNLVSHLTESGLENMNRSGHGILSALFGDKLSALLSWFSRFIGIKGSATSTLMNVASSLVMAVLGKQVLQHRLSAYGLSSLLAGQGSWLSRLLPSGVSKVPGLSGLADIGERAGAAARGAAEYGGQAVDAVRGAARDVYRGTAGAAHVATPWLSALLPLALIGLPLLAAPFIMRGCAAKTPEVAKGPDTKGTISNYPAPEVNVPEVKVPVVKAPDVKPPDLAKMVQIKLPNDVEISIPENSFLRDVHKFVADASDVKPRTFVLETINFDGAAVKTSPETETATKVLCALLKAFPGVRLRIEGHTDNSGEEATNKRISLERANAVKDVLVKAGALAERITTEGLGSEKPMAPNDTEAGRAKNRRIEMQVVKK